MRLNTVEAHEVLAPATIWAAKTSYATPSLARIQTNTREIMGWSEFARAKLAVAVGERPGISGVLRCTGERAEELYSLLASPRVG